MRRQVFRVQDVSGRGPFRPGFSHNWADEFFAPGMKELPTWGKEFGDDLIRREGYPNEHFGSAVLCLEHIKKWFSETERAKLQRLGFNIVSMMADRILGESPNQVVFARRRPLSKGCIIIPWSSLTHESDASA